eukprot:1431450-Pleurochrysis_carterae.AAC.1
MAWCVPHGHGRHCSIAVGIAGTNFYITLTTQHKIALPQTSRLFAGIFPLRANAYHQRDTTKSACL